MSLNWNWSDKVGTLEAIVDVREGEEWVKKPHTFNLYQGNALLIAIDEFKEDGVEKYNLYTFFADEYHLKNLLGMNKKDGYTENHLADWGWKKIRINTKKWYPKGFGVKLSKLVGLLIDGLPDLTIELYAE